MDQEPRFSSQQKLDPDPRYLRTINGRRFILYAGLIELAKRSSLISLEVEIQQFPSEANGHTAVARSTAVLANGRKASDIGEANPLNLDSRVVIFPLSLAATRSKARCLRNLLGVSMTAIEELKDFEGVIGEEPENQPENSAHPPASTSPSLTPSAPVNHPAPVSAPATNVHQFPTSGGNSTGTPATEAQLRAISAIAKRRKLSSVELANFCRTATSKGLDELSKKDASKLIDSLKQAA